MATVGVFYATKEGQTRRIAEHVGNCLRDRGVSIEVRDVEKTNPDGLTGYTGVVLAASVHAGRHEKAMVKFVKKNRHTLERIPHAFLTVSLSQAGVERSTATPDERARFTADVQKMLDEFVRVTGWRPNKVIPVAGALLYTKYNFLVRFIMKRISSRAGGATDTTRDYEYTDWSALDRCAAEFASMLLGNPLKDAI
jgi:menaquinone-dependent protoporphyrinogen oxidase